MGVRRVGMLLGLLGSCLTGLQIAAPARAAALVDDAPSPSWTVDGTVYATLVVGDRIFVGGSFANAISPTGVTVPRKNLAAFSMATGALEAGWRADAGSTVRALVSDGSWLYVGGAFARLAGAARSRLGRVEVSSGRLDPAFRPSLDNTVRALELGSTRLYAGGTFLTAGGVAHARLAALSPATGAVIPQFTGSASAAVYALRLSPDESVLYTAGAFGALNGTTRAGVGALRPDTGRTTGPAFGSSAKPTFGLAISDDGTRLFGAGGAGSNAAAAWNTTTGVRTWRVVTDGDVQAIAYFGDTVYFGFHDGFQGDSHVKALAADATSGAVDPAFRPDVAGFWGVWSISATGAGLVLGGDFTSVSGVPARGFARFPRSVDPPPPPPRVTEYLGAQTAWHYDDLGSAPSDWISGTFDDSGWPAGIPQLGYGDDDESTVLSYGPSASDKHLTYYFRSSFEVGEVPAQLALLLAADDGAVAYLNGVEVVRDNLPAGEITATTRASSTRSGGAENALRPFTVDPALLVPGINTLAVEVHQDLPGSSDVTFDAQLTGTFPGL